MSTNYVPGVFCRSLKAVFTPGKCICRSTPTYLKHMQRYLILHEKGKGSFLELSCL